MIVVLLGPPGSGKGTQAKKVSSDKKWPQLSTGDMLRAAISQGTATGKEAKSFMDQGQLVPDAVVIKLIAERSQAPDCKAGFILDGFPRNIPQAESLDQMLATQGRKVDRAILFNIRDEELIKRLTGRRTCLKCGAMFHVDYAPSKKHGICDTCGSSLVQRDDDSAEVVTKRLKVYHQQTEPLVGFYRQQGKLRELDASKSPSAVTEALVKALA